MTRQPWKVLRAALLVAVVAIGAAAAWGGELNDTIRVSGAESDAALQFAIDAMPYRLGISARIVLVTDDASQRIDDTANTAELKELVRRLRELPHVGEVPPALGPGTVSDDGRAALVTVTYKDSPDETDLARLEQAVGTAAGIRGEVGGILPEVASDPEAGSEIVGVVAALVILLIVFGSVVAAGLPLLVAIAALGVGTALILLMAGFADVSSLAPQLAATIGLGVGIDYSLLVLTRHREGRRAGMSVRRSVDEAVRTAGHSVAVAGSIVVVSILGLAITGVELLFMMGVATAICVAATVIASLTVLPAVIVLLGERLDPKGRPNRPLKGVPKRPSEHSWEECDADDEPDHHRDPRFERLARWAMRHRVPVAVVVTLVLLMLAAPALSMRVGYNDASTAPEHSTQRQAYDLITKHFGEGHNTDFTAFVNVVTGRPELRQANADLVASTIAATPGVAAAGPSEFGFGGEQATVSFFTTTGAQDAEAGRTLQLVRERVHAALNGTGVEGLVGGATAIRIDFAERVSTRLPWLIGTVVLLSMLLMLWAFRSPAIALKAAIMNLLSIGTAYGAVVAVFQWGQGIPVDAYVPVFLFAILFGLSMDYEVFLLSRISEEYHCTGDNELAVARGIGATASVVTSAALVMVGVFAGFLFGGDVVVKMFGVGLTTAIIVDVTLVRMMLLPATMALLGHWNWWPGRPRPS